MAKTVTITNGQGTANLINSTYSATATVAGYDNSSLQPTSITVQESSDTYAFTIAASGNLTLHVTEDGTSTGTPIVGATFVRTDATGTEYGSTVTTDSQGNAILANVPYSATNAPTVYYKQTASDGDHEFVNTVQNTTLTASSATVEVINQPGASRTISLTDANYSNLPIDEGTLTLTN